MTTAAGRVAVVYRDNRGKDNRGKDNRDERTEFCRFDPTWKVTMTMPDGGLFSSPREIMKFLPHSGSNDVGPNSNAVFPLKVRVVLGRFAHGQDDASAIVVSFCSPSFSLTPFYPGWPFMKKRFRRIARRANWVTGPGITRLGIFWARSSMNAGPTVTVLGRPRS